jgi:hypothetical protein
MNMKKNNIPRCCQCNQAVVKDQLVELPMDKKTRDLIDKHLDSLPMYHMKFRFLSLHNGQEYDSRAESDEWFLPLMKKKVKMWNEEAMNPKCDPNHENYAWYVRIK